MEVLSFLFGILFSAVFLPICFVLIVSFRRSILDGQNVGNLSSKYVLITGCDSGFGFELAKRLDSLGCHVIATCLTKEGQDRLKAVASSRLNTLSMDVTKTESIEAAEKKVREMLPSMESLWGIVNNAGILGEEPNFDFATIDYMKRVSDVNLWGTVRVTKAFLPYLKRSKGRIVNMCSLAGRLAIPAMLSYCISKFGITAFTDCIRLELSLFGISVHIIEPGFYKTNISVNHLENIRKFWDNSSEELRKEYGKKWLDENALFIGKITQDGNTNLYEVIDCMEHALLSNNAKTRYFPDRRTAFFSWWLALLPADIVDGFMLKRRQLPVPARIAESSS